MAILTLPLMDLPQFGLIDMQIVERPLSQRLANTFTPLNMIVTLLVLGGGIGLSQLLVAPRFGMTLILTGLLGTVPIALILLVRPWFGVTTLFVASMIIIAVKRLAWTLEVGLVIEFLTGVLALGLAFAIILRRDLWRLSSPLTVPVIIFISYQLLLSFHPGLPTVFNIIYSLRDVINFSVPFFLALYLVRDRYRLQQFAILWLGTAVIIALYGMKQRFFGLNSWESAWLSISPTHVIYGQVRIFSTLGSADALGMHMAISIVIALAFAIQTRSLWSRFICLSIIPLFVMTTLYTLTRGAYMAVVVGVLALAIITRSRVLLLTLFVAFGLAIGWYQMDQNSLLASRVVSAFSPEDDASYAVRQSYIDEYFPLIADNPFGLGPATSGRQGGTLLSLGNLDPRFVESLAGVPTDNYYFRIALENGWIGLLLFLALLALVFVFGLRLYAKSRDPLIKWFTAAILASYAAMTVASLSNNYFSHVDLKLFFWFSMGILANISIIEHGEQGHTRPVVMPSRTARLEGVRPW